MAILPQHHTPHMPLLKVPFVSFDRKCGDLGRRYSCNRPEGHGGRHSYSWRNITAGPLQGIVRAVWSR